MASPEKTLVVTYEDYYKELSNLGVWGAQRKRLRSSYFSILGQISAISREQNVLLRRVPTASIINRVIIGERIRQLDKDRAALLKTAREIMNKTLPALEQKIEKELTRFRQKIKPPPPPKPPQLYRVKIRLYNMERAPTPAGMLQGWFTVDAILDPETGLVDWKWWLTQEEINMAKYHFVGYWKGMSKWNPPNQVNLAYFDDKNGIPDKDSAATYKTTKTGNIYAKNVPSDIIAKAKNLTIEELIVGESSQEPEPNTEPTSENMGLFFERTMAIGPEGQIKWDEYRNKWPWKPTENQVEEVKEELDIE